MDERNNITFIRTRPCCFISMTIRTEDLMRRLEALLGTLHGSSQKYFGHLSHILWGLEFDQYFLLASPGSLSIPPSLPPSPPPSLPPSLPALCCPSWQLATSTSDSAWRWDKLKHDWMELKQFLKEQKKNPKKNSAVASEKELNPTNQIPH